MFDTPMSFVGAEHNTVEPELYGFRPMPTERWTEACRQRRDEIVPLSCGRWSASQHDAVDLFSWFQEQGALVSSPQLETTHPA